MKLLLSLILILNLIYNCNSATISFSDKVDCISTACQWNKATNWVGGVIPTSTDDVIIQVGTSAVVQGTKDNVSFKSLLLGSILSIESGSTSTSPIYLSQMTINGRLIIKDQLVSVSTTSGAGVITVDPSTDTSDQTTISSTNIDLLEIAGAAKVIVYGSFINAINQIKSKVTAFNDTVPALSFTYTSSIGALNMESVPTFTPQSVFTITNGLQTSINNVIGISAGQTWNLEYTSAITGSYIDNIAQLVLTGNSNCKIKDSTIIGGLQSQPSSTIQFSGSNTLNSSVTLGGSVVINSDSLQTNIEGGLVFTSATKLSFNTLGSGAPLVTVGESLVLDGSIVINVAEQPDTDSSFKLLKSIGGVSGNFTSFSFKVGGEEVDSSTYKIMVGNGIFGIDFGDDVSSTSKIQFSFTSLILLSIISLLF